MIPVSVGVLVWVLAILVGSIAVLQGGTFAVRLLRERGEGRQRRFRDRWEPVLHARLTGDRISLPRLAPSERPLFLALWLHLLGYVREEAAKNLAQVARDLGLESYVLGLLDSPTAWRRMLAIHAVSALRLEQAAGRLMASALPARARSSLAAVRALLLVRPEEGLSALQRLLGAPDWSPESVVEVFKIGGSGATEALERMIAAAPRGKAKRLVRLAELLEDASILPALRERLLSNRDEVEIAAILRTLGRLGSAEDRLAIRSFLSHGSWVVRVQAAAATGQLGLPEDHRELLPLLRDKQWWVRYRAAQSLLRLVGRATLQELRDREGDRYARDMLDHVMAEGD